MQIGLRIYGINNNWSHSIWILIIQGFNLSDAFAFSKYKAHYAHPLYFIITVF